jgi:1-deoxy-D-xylulose-5-phosphate reductoisomerase
MRNATLAEATNHPTWSMGQKISIDSATMMNKALEVIEAHWLFSLPADKIKVIIHPQSVIHSMVYYKDGSVLAQMANPDMRVPISYGLSYPNRFLTNKKHLDLIGKKFEFFAVDCVKYPNVGLAYEALKNGGTSGCIMNAANEIAVNAFINKKIKLTDIYNCVKYALDNCTLMSADNIESIIDADNTARTITKQYITTL